MSVTAALPDRLAMRRRPARRRRGLPYLLILPAVAAEAAFVLLPILRGLWASVSTESGFGFDAYRQMLRDPDFAPMMLRTFGYAVTVDTLTLLAALCVALLMNWRFAGRSVIRSLLTIPWAMPEVPVAITFVFMLDPNFGVANRMARALPWVTQNPQWLLDPALAMAAVLLVSVWKAFPFHSLVMLSALQSVPDELHDAAQLDGAGAWMRFRHVTLPYLRTTLALLAVLAFVFAMQQFTLIWLLTGGGPGDATTTLALDIYLRAFRFYDPAAAGAVAVAGLLLAALAALAFVTLQHRLAVERP